MYGYSIVLSDQWRCPACGGWETYPPRRTEEMFRFIDVLPMLRTSESLTRHLQEYFDEVRQHLPTAVRLGVAAATPGAPDAVEGVHASFLDVGCDVLETDTFRSNRITLAEYGLGDRVREINVAAAQIARLAADRFAEPGRPRFVAGSIGPSGYLPSASDPTLGNITFDELVPVFAEQARGLIEGGVDVLLIETSQDILEVKAAIFGCRQAIRAADRPVALQVQVTLDTSGRMLLGTDVAAAMVTLESLGADVIGLNCSTGPDYMRDPARYLGEHATKPVAIIPNAGIPINDRTMKDGQPFILMESTPSNTNWQQTPSLKKPGQHRQEMLIAIGHGAAVTAIARARGDHDDERRSPHDPCLRCAGIRTRARYAATQAGSSEAGDLSRSPQPNTRSDRRTGSRRGPRGRARGKSMIIALTVVHVIMCFAIIAIVLLQAGKGADIGSAFGGAGSQAVFGSMGTPTVLGKITGAVAGFLLLPYVYLLGKELGDRRLGLFAAQAAMGLAYLLGSRSPCACTMATSRHASRARSSTMSATRIRASSSRRCLFARSLAISPAVTLCTSDRPRTNRAALISGI